MVCPHTGLYTHVGTWEDMEPDARQIHLIRSLARQHPDWIFCGPSAALLHGLFVSFADLHVVHIIGPCKRGSGMVLRHHRRELPVEVVNGIRVTKLDQTTFDCMRSMPFRRALGIADSYLAQTGLDVDGTIKRIGVQHRGKRRIRSVREVLSHANPLAENGGESYARAVMIEEGVMLPRLQVPFRVKGRAEPYRVDFLWEIRVGSRIIYVAGELDGLGKWMKPELMGGRDFYRVKRDESNRESDLTSLGLQVARFTIDDCMAVEPLLARLRRFRIPRANGMPL